MGEWRVDHLPKSSRTPVARPVASSHEMFIRSHYLLSPALANLGLLFLLAIPFGAEF
jgi:hypothetical protein